MKNTKREFPFYASYDRTHIERHLTDMAEQGWLLEKMENYGWVYRRDQPRGDARRRCRAGRADDGADLRLGELQRRT